jgi:hypothetical protein
MGPAVLITLGLLFLLANKTGYAFERTWPILLIVIGAIKVVRYVMPDDSHWNPQYGPSYVGQAAPPGVYPPPPYQQAMPQAGVAQNDAQNVAQNVAQNEAPAGASVVTPSPMTGAADSGSEGNSEVQNG